MNCLELYLNKNVRSIVNDYLMVDNEEMKQYYNKHILKVLKDLKLSELSYFDCFNKCEYPNKVFQKICCRHFSGDYMLNRLCKNCTQERYSMFGYRPQCCELRWDEGIGWGQVLFYHNRLPIFC